MIFGNAHMKGQLFITAAGYVIFSTYSALALAESALHSIDDLPLVAIGPVSYKDSRLTVNGQAIIRDGETTIEAEDGSPHARLRQGDYVAVTGDLMEPGRALATAIVVLDEEYVEGASPTYLRAIIESTSSSGVAYSAGSQVDFTPSLFQTELANIAQGDIAEFIGFNSDQLLVATEGGLVDTDGSMNAGLLGSSVQGIRTSGTRGIRTSGTRGIRTSGTRGIRTSGTR